MADKTAEIIEGEGVFITKSGTPVYIKASELCAMTGTSRQWIGKLVKEGVLTKAETSLGSIFFELAPTIRQYIGMLENRANAKNSEDKKNDSDLKKANAKLKSAKAAIATMDAQERAGMMHRSEDVAAMTEDLIYTIRGGLLALPGRLAVDVASAKTAAEVSDIIRTEVYKLMSELSNYKYDPEKYKERVRERLKIETVNDDAEEE